MNDLIPKATLADIAGHRERALEHYRQAAEHVLAGNKAADAACPAGSAGLTFSLSSEAARQLAHGIKHGKDFVEACRHELDAAIWRHVLRATTLADVLDAKARAELSKALERDCPPADFETLAATLQTLVGQSPAMIKRGVVELFRALSKPHRTNDAFRVGHRLVLARVFSSVSGGDAWQPWNHFSSGREHLVDLERTLHVLDGRRAPEYDATIAAKVDSARTLGARAGDRAREIETEYLHMHWFQNGNAHVTIKRTDLLEAVNRIIAEHFGAVLPDAAD